MILAPSPTITMPVTIWPVTRARANPVEAVMSPNPTVVNTVTVKYKASVRVRGSLKLADRDPTHDEIRGGKQQQKQRNARRKSSNRPQRRICCPDDRADLKSDEYHKRHEPDY